MMHPSVQAVITVLVTVIASSGFWAGFWVLIQKRTSQRDATTSLLLGLAHDRIIFLGMSYLERGWITHDEYDDFIKYLYQPYSEFGGNGLAEKVKHDVDKLPITKQGPPRPRRSQ